MSGYGFGRKPARAAGAGEGGDEAQRLDLSGIERRPVVVDPAREEAALARGAALGFVDRAAGETAESASPGASRRRRRPAQPQGSVFIKGPQDTLDWFIDYTNRRGHRSYWQTLEEFRALVEREQAGTA